MHWLISLPAKLIMSTIKTEVELIHAYGYSPVARECGSHYHPWRHPGQGREGVWPGHSALRPLDHPRQPETVPNLHVLGRFAAAVSLVGYGAVCYCSVDPCPFPRGLIPLSVSPAVGPRPCPSTPQPLHKVITLPYPGHAAHPSLVSTRVLSMCSLSFCI